MKKVIIYILVAIVMLAIASRGMGCGVKDWFDEKINQNNTSSSDVEENDTSYSEDSFEEPVLTPEIYAYANGEKITSVDIYDDGDFTFEVKANEYADASAEVDITSAPEGAEGEIKQNEGEWVFVPDAGIEGNYVITITSLANDDLVTTVTITVAKAPAIETILSKKYMNSNRTKDNQFVFDSLLYEGSKTQGDVIVTFEGKQVDYASREEFDVKYVAMYTFEYDPDTKDFKTTDVVLEGDFRASDLGYEDFEYKADLLGGVTVNADYTLSVTYYNQTMTAKLEPYVEDNTDEIEVSTGSEMDESISSLDE